ncbi:MAG: hypothetical protein LBR43_03935 [Spiroplasmataceae bacterium]|jgi:small subunit ribosomal protein S7|nr:hypothetical protein [Spiroplasmataceae bacterium]
MRKKRIIKNRSIKPDKRFDSILVSQLINKIMKDGKKRKATNIVYQSAEIVEKNISEWKKGQNFSIESSQQLLKENFSTILKGAVDRVKPVVEMKSKKLGASKRRTPQKIDDIRSTKIALRWIVEGAREIKSTNLIHMNLAEEISNAHGGKGEAFEKRKNLHKEAESLGYSFSEYPKKSNSNEEKNPLESQQ